MLVRLPVTVMLVLGRVVAGVTVTVSRVWPAGSTEDGVAPPTPEILVGSPPQTFAGEALLRGSGPVITKSLALLLVSMQPLFLRTAPTVELPTPVAVPSAQLGTPAPP